VLKELVATAGPVIPASKNKKECIVKFDLYFPRPNSSKIGSISLADDDRVASGDQGVEAKATAT